MKPATCHPDKPVVARGMCNNCYHRWRRENNPDARQKEREYARDNYKKNRERQKEYRNRNAHKVRDRVNKYKEKNKDRLRNQSRMHNLLVSCRKAGITIEEYDEFFYKQGGMCAICGNTITADPNNVAKEKTGMSNGHRAHIDHSHKTGSYRGLLCGHCNVGLGHFKDDPMLLESAARYLREHT